MNEAPPSGSASVIPYEDLRSIDINVILPDRGRHGSLLLLRSAANRNKSGSKKFREAHSVLVKFYVGLPLNTLNGIPVGLAVSYNE